VLGEAIIVLSEVPLLLKKKEIYSAFKKANNRGHTYRGYPFKLKRPKSSNSWRANIPNERVLKINTLNIDPSIT